ncbi:hypothetical protein PoB_006610400 [Plakobranchus ocellatus]|uniref:Uncharacterized protein n=1 Tax=Plakobranchus ocellatus TaxID=259542 RepID=A0AAV4D619_9GAST|nr:hypothetical protein PoB_006610400 [Plakobranchus ocellatus]
MNAPRYLVSWRGGGQMNSQRLPAMFLYIACPQQGDLRLLGPPSGQGAGSGARTRDRRVPANITADLLDTVPPKPHYLR